MQVRILMVEDEAIDRLRVEKMVKKEALPYELTIATTIAEALALIKKNDFDLALVDYNLPDGLGVEVLRQAGRIPCIFITAQDNTATAVEVMKAGACDFLVKDDLGYNLKLLPTMVERALERRRTDELTRAVTRLQKEIKERKQVEQELKRSFSLLQATLESTVDGILVVDNQSNWTGYNSQFVRMWNIPDEVLASRDKDRALGCVLGQLIYPERYLEKVKELQSQPDSVSHDTLEFKDGRIIERYSRPQLVEGDPVGRVWSFHDNTERLQRERELETVALVGNALRAAVSRAEMLPIIINQAVDLLDAQTACLEFIDPVSGDSVMELGYGAWEGLEGMRIPPSQGLNTYIRANNQLYMSNNVADDPMVLDPALFKDLKALAGAPMIAQGELMGFLWIGRKVDFNLSDLRPLTAIADISANAIRRTTLHEQTEGRLMKLAALREIDAAINRSHNLNETMIVLLENTVTQLHADAANILLMDSQSQMLEYMTGTGFLTTVFTPAFIKVGESQAGWAAKERKSVQVFDLSSLEIDPLLRDAAAREGFVSYFGVPLVAKNEVKGVLEIYLRRPFIPDQEWLNFLDTVAGSAAIAIDEAQLFQELRLSNMELQRSFDATIEAFSNAMGDRDKETYDHMRGVTELSLSLAAHLGISEADMVHVQRGAVLHDIGKLGVPDKVLQKEGPLDEAEWVLMRRHPENAYNWLKHIEFLQLALDIPYCHHEKWDGSGYPRGLKGEEIPLSARIFAVVDVWNALTSDRVYRKAWSNEKALAHIKASAGTHFDPMVVEAFVHIIELEGTLK